MSEDSLVLRGPQAHRAPPVPRVHKVLRVRRAQLVLPALQVPSDRRVPLVLLGLLDLPEVAQV